MTRSVDVVVRSAFGRRRAKELLCGRGRRGAALGALLGALVLVPALPGLARADDIRDCRMLDVAACRRAADAGDAGSQTMLAAMLETGRGTPQDLLEAAAWYRRAADQGSRLAAARLTALVASHHLEPADQLAVRSLPPFPASRTGAAPSAVVQRPATVAADLARLPQWQRVRNWIVDDTGAQRDPALAGWASWAQGLRDRPIGDRLVAINDRVNDSFRYAGDSEVWGERNHWPTPSEVVAKGATDCKGYAIMKLWLARLAGVGDENLKLVVGTLPTTYQMHAVLRVDAGGRPLLLDSLRPTVVVDGTTDLNPVLTADLQGLELFVDRLATLGN
jgi:predicted transglutaminase-like cysteine proteinase